MDLLSDEDEEVESFLFAVKETAHSLSPILGLALVVLFLIHLRIVKGMISGCGSETSWTFLVLFGVGATRVVALLFWRATCTRPSSSSLVFQPLWDWGCGYWTHRNGHNIIVLCLLFVLCYLASSLSSSSSSFCDCFLAFILFYCSAIIFWTFLATKLFRSFRLVLL